MRCRHDHEWEPGPDDPSAARLAEIGEAARGAAADVDLFLSLDSVFAAAPKNDPRFVKALVDAYGSLCPTATHPA